MRNVVSNEEFHIFAVNCLLCAFAALISLPPKICVHSVVFIGPNIFFVFSFAYFPSVFHMPGLSSAFADVISCFFEIATSSTILKCGYPQMVFKKPMTLQTI